MLLGRKIPIVLDKPSKDEYGSFETRPNRIRLDDNLEPETFRAVLTHELVHAALSISGVTEHIELPVEEQICVVMESAFIDIWEALRKFEDHTS